MRVLCLTTYFPLPQDQGGVVRALGVLQSLAREADIHVLARARPTTTPELVEQLRAELGAPIEVFPAPPETAGPRAVRAARWRRSIAGGFAPWIDRTRSEALARRARELAPAFDVAVSLDDHSHIYARDIGTLVPTVLDRQNVLGWSLRERGPREPGPRARIRHEVGRRLESRYEASDHRYGVGPIVTSPLEAERWETLYGRPPLAAVPSAIDLLPPRRTRPDARGVAWLGDHRYHANVEGLLRFANEAWAPLGENGHELLVIGREPSPEVLGLERLPGVRILGYVPDLDDVLNDARAAVVPLWHGAGVKLKTLTLMGAGLPTVATPVALEGIDAEHRRHCLIAGEPAGLGRELAAVLGDAELATRVGAEGRRLIEDSYTWRGMGPRFVDVVRRAARDGATA